MTGTIPKESGLVGRRLADTKIRGYGALVIAMHLPDGEYLYNPPGEHQILAGSALIVLAEVPDVQRLRAGIAGGGI